MHHGEDQERVVKEAAVHCKARRRGRGALLDHSACATPAGQQAAARQELPAIPPMTARRGARTTAVRTRDRRAEVSPAHLAPARYLGARSGTFPRPVTAPRPVPPLHTVCYRDQPVPALETTCSDSAWSSIWNSPRTLHSYWASPHLFHSFSLSRHRHPSIFNSAQCPSSACRVVWPFLDNTRGPACLLHFTTLYPEGMLYPGFPDGD